MYRRKFPAGPPETPSVTESMPINALKSRSHNELSSRPNDVINQLPLNMNILPLPEPVVYNGLDYERVRSRYSNFEPAAKNTQNLVSELKFIICKGEVEALDSILMSERHNILWNDVR